MKTLLLSTLTLLIMLSGKAFSKEITCTTSNKLKTFKIHKKSITFITMDENSRSLASVKKVASRRTRTGFNKMLVIEGKKHIFHIGNIEKFSQLEDYYIVRNNKSHEVIYPLECQ